MPYEFVVYEKKGRTAYITINRPERLNAVHPPTNAELRRAFVDFRDDPDLWVAILTGTGDHAFSAGNDLKYAAERGRHVYPSEGEPSFGGITEKFVCWKPIIAAVNGYALGGGLEMALACDIIIAADHAEFGLPEGKVGLVPNTGAHRLPRQIPLKLAMGMMLTGRRISAKEAYRIGLVNEVVPAAELMSTAEAWANEILEVAPLSARAIKQMALSGLGSPLDVALKGRYSEFDRMLTSDDVEEGPKAFAEKRKPRWTGA